MWDRVVKELPAAVRGSLASLYPSLATLTNALTDCNQEWPFGTSPQLLSPRYPPPSVAVTSIHAVFCRTPFRPNFWAGFAEERIACRSFVHYVFRARGTKKCKGVVKVWKRGANEALRRVSAAKPRGELRGRKLFLQEKPRDPYPAGAGDPYRHVRSMESVGFSGWKNRKYRHISCDGMDLDRARYNRLDMSDRYCGVATGYLASRF